MMRFLMLLFAFSTLAAQSIVFVHLGPALPKYLPTAIKQARLFNPTCPIYLVANKSALQKSPLGHGAIPIAAESLQEMTAHRTFRQKTQLNSSWRDGFWLYTTERFFYLCELMEQHNLSDVIHLESDVMLYEEIDRWLPIFSKHYAGKIGATFDNDERCIAGCLYISNAKPLNRFVKFLADRTSSNKNDMESLAEFRKTFGNQWIASLPIIMPRYAIDQPLVSPYNHRAAQPEFYSNHFDEFLSLFDAAAIGQYLGGIDPNNAPIGPGFINESCVFDPSKLQYNWVVDAAGRRVPMASYKGETYRINNLHIHCKDLDAFYFDCDPHSSAN